MLECKLCDYYKALNGNASKCGFTGVLFKDDVENLEMEYPCRNMTYDEYLSRNKVESVNTFGMTNNDWRFVYKKQHAANAIDRYLRRAI